MIKRFFCLLIFILICFETNSAEIIREDHLFNQGVGARPLAMGNAFTGVADDINAVFYNPAGIASIDKFSLLGLSSKRMMDVDASTLLSAWPTETWGTFAFGTTALIVPSIALAGYDPVENKVYKAGDAFYEERLWLLGWGRRINEDISLGLNLKSYTIGFSTNVDTYDSYRARGYDVDIGFLWKLNWRLSLGIMWQNAASTLSKSGGLEWSTGSIERFDGGPRVG
ncbi:MAG: hypothetical protein KKA19_04255, partial [Candidatus Margulisbacteria bacterium]|nr:hypothetical protein [Candidatus Margulisiibacteriota bacterium]